MKRRTLIGLGAMTVGGASVLGTGAFTSVEAERTLTVDVVGDESALLRLRPYCGGDSDETGEDSDENGEVNGDSQLRSSDFVYETDDGTIAIDLTESIQDNGSGNIKGDGITEESLWRFPNAFEIANQGTQPVVVDFEVRDEDGEVTINSSGGADVGGEERTFEDGDPAAVFYPGSNDAPGNLFNDGDIDGLVLIPSESQCIGFNVRTFGFGPDDDPFGDATLRITADASEEDEIKEPQAGLGITLNDIDDQTVGEAFDITGAVENNSPDETESEVALEILDGDDTTAASDDGGNTMKTTDPTVDGESTSDFEFGDITLEDSGTYTAVATATADDVAPVSDSVTFEVNDSEDSE